MSEVEAPTRIWMRADVLSSPELLEHFQKLNADDVPYDLADLAPVAVREAAIHIAQRHRDVFPNTLSVDAVEKILMQHCSTVASDAEVWKEAIEIAKRHEHESDWTVHSYNGGPKLSCREAVVLELEAAAKKREVRRTNDDDKTL